jgi:hypothetical protein
MCVHIYTYTYVTVCVCVMMMRESEGTAVEVRQDPGNEGLFRCWAPTVILLLACLVRV